MRCEGHFSASWSATGAHGCGHALRDDLVSTPPVHAEVTISFDIISVPAPTTWVERAADPQHAATRNHVPNYDALKSLADVQPGSSPR